MTNDSLLDSLLLPQSELILWNISPHLHSSNEYIWTNLWKISLITYNLFPVYMEHKPPKISIRKIEQEAHIDKHT